MTVIVASSSGVSDVGVTQKLYEDDPGLLEFQSRLLSRNATAGGEEVVLESTAFYATSGGQPHDVGELGGATVVDVFHRDGEVVHRLAAPLPPEVAAGSMLRGVVDRVRRMDYLRQHHGQHLLSAALFRTARIETVSVHFGAETSTLDCATLVPDDRIAAAAALANQVVLEDRPVRVHRATRDELSEFDLRREPGIEADVLRLIEVEGFDTTPCSGTHPRSTGQVGPIAVLGTERAKGRTRVSFLCGERALRDHEAKIAIVRDLARDLSVAPASVSAQVEKLRAAERDARRRLKAAEEALAEFEAARLVAAEPSPVVATLLEPDASEERMLALGARVAQRGKCAVIGAQVADRAMLLIAAPGKPFDAGAALKAGLPAIDGKGGGGATSARGSGAKLAGLRAAVDACAAALRG